MNWKSAKLTLVILTATMNAAILPDSFFDSSDSASLIIWGALAGSAGVVFLRVFSAQHRNSKNILSESLFPLNNAAVIWHQLFAMLGAGAAIGALIGCLCRGTIPSLRIWAMLATCICFLALRRFLAPKEKTD